MKNKKIKTLGAISIATATLGLLVAIVSANGGFDNFVSAGEHSSDCVWNHYASTDPQENMPGNKEYWVCCVDHESVFTEPTVGKINDGTKQLTSEQIKALGKDDPRYISPSNVTSVIDSINDLPDLDMSGGVIPNVGYQVVLDEYNKISEEYIDEVTNKDKLLEFNDYFECVVLSSDMNAFPETTTNDSVDTTYGTYRGFTCTWEKTNTEKQSAHNLITKINFDDYDYFTFAIYNPNATTGWHFTANDWQHYLDLSSNTVIAKSPVTTTTAPQGWNVITLSSDDMKTMFTKSGETIQSIYWGPYLGGSAAYGLQFGETIKITNFYGIKSAYYEAQAKGVIGKINCILSLDKDNLTLWNGGQILEARSEYNALPETVKKYVTNYSKLQEYETAYADIGSALNYKWKDGTLNGTTTISTNNVGYDSTYGIYSEIAATSSWLVDLSPVGDTTVTKTAKVAIFNPNGSKIQLYFYNNPSWKWGDGYTDADWLKDANPGWNEYEIPTVAFNNSIVSKISIVTANINEITNIKLTPFYVEA